MKDLQEKLKDLKDLGVVGVKQSTEDEGARYEDISLIRDITRSVGLKLSVKVGGCEAISDMDFCSTIAADSIVAPMIESQFALQKFTESVSRIKDTDFYINVESKTAVTNIREILESGCVRLLKGVVVGRSDLSKSYGYGKGMVDSLLMQGKVEDILSLCKSRNLRTLMGGNINVNSIPFIKGLYEKSLINCVETRNIILELDDNNIDNLDDIIRQSILFESTWLNFKAEKYLGYGNSYRSRAEDIKKRL